MKHLSAIIGTLHWLKDNIRLLIKEKTTTYKYFRQNGNNIYLKHRFKRPHLNSCYQPSKGNYYNRMANKL